MALNVWVEEESLWGSILTIYRVMVNGKEYDRMHLNFGPRLTWAQQKDIADGYREALDESQVIQRSDAR